MLIYLVTTEFDNQLFMFGSAECMPVILHNNQGSELKSIQFYSAKANDFQ